MAVGYMGYPALRQQARCKPFILYTGTFYALQWQQIHCCRSVQRDRTETKGTHTP